MTETAEESNWEGILL